MASVELNNLSDAIADVMNEYGDTVYNATEKGLTAGQKVLITSLKGSSPVGKTGEFKRSWKGKGTKYKLKRYVGNTKMVNGKKSDIPLSNILEYSENSKVKGFIKRTFDGSITAIAQAIIDEIKRSD